METYDLAVIGGGPGGYPAAIRAAQLGASVALIEKEALGGACLNWGCIPTKTLISAAGLYQSLRHAGRFGLRADNVAFDYAAILQSKRQIVDKLRNGIAQLLKGNGVKVFEGTAALAARNRLVIRTSRAGATRLEAARIIIASGSRPALPAFLPRADVILDSRAFLELEKLPRRLIVLGGGVIGCELACLAAQFGVEVTVVEILEDILMLLDADARAAVRRSMEQNLKIRVLTGKALEKISAGREGVRGTAGDRTIEADLLLAAVGRQPATEDLALDQAGIEPNGKGYIEVDARGQTKVTGIYAVGDVTGGPQLAHAATAQGLMAAEAALGQERRLRQQVVPACIFTAPEIGAVGLTEQAAREQQRPVVVGKFPFAALGRALAAGAPQGFVKWVAAADTGQLLGAQAVGGHATELIAEATTAIQAELTLAEVAHTVHAHPTLAEAWMEAAHVALGSCIHAAPKRRPGTGKH